MNNPIGIFDSGVGGLTVAKAIRKLLPQEDVIYFGDTAHLPYGEKSPEAIRNYSLRIAEFLVESGAKAIVIACNSASAVATDLLKDRFEPNIPVVNVIDPVVQAINKNITDVGIIGTRATIGSGVYQDKITTAYTDKKVHALATPLLVPIIEEGLEKSIIAKQALEHYLSMPEMENIQALIPGCTHYPLLSKTLRELLGKNTVLIDTPNIVAKHTLNVLTVNDLLAHRGSPGRSKFFVSDYTPTFERIARNFFKEKVELTELDIWK